MAIKHVVIHQCDLCGKTTKPSHIAKIAVGLDKFDSCEVCTSKLRIFLEGLTYLSDDNEQDEG